MKNSSWETESEERADSSLIRTMKMIGGRQLPNRPPQSYLPKTLLRQMRKTTSIRSMILAPYYESLRRWKDAPLLIEPRMLYDLKEDAIRD